MLYCTSVSSALLGRSRQECDEFKVWVTHREFKVGSSLLLDFQYKIQVTLCWRVKEHITVNKYPRNNYQVMLAIVLADLRHFCENCWNSYHGHFLLCMGWGKKRAKICIIIMWPKAGILSGGLPVQPKKTKNMCLWFSWFCFGNENQSVLKSSKYPS